eukprot:3158055-Amphidinium_carterae.2
MERPSPSVTLHNATHFGVPCHNRRNPALHNMYSTARPYYGLTCLRCYNTPSCLQTSAHNESVTLRLKAIELTMSLAIWAHSEHETM